MTGRIKHILHMAIEDFSSSTSGSFCALFDYLENSVFITLIDSSDERPLSNEWLLSARSAFAFWESHLSIIAQKAESTLQQWLPGKSVSTEEMILVGIKLWSIDNIDSSVTFSTRIGGDYSNPKFDLSEFDDDAVLEIIVLFKNGQPDIEQINFETFLD